MCDTSYLAGTIKDGAQISSVIYRDIKPYALMVSILARKIDWMRKIDEQIFLPIKGQGQHLKRVFS